MTDLNECIERDVLPKMYQDAKGSAIPGYADFIEITSTVILAADECC